MKIFVELDSSNTITQASESRFLDTNKEIETNIGIENLVGSKYQGGIITVNTMQLKNSVDREAKRRIQTIPAAVRSNVLGKKKENDKTYTDTWHNFYQRCQNIRFDADILHEKAAREAAKWVVERIETFTNKRDQIKERLDTLSVQELEGFDVTDDSHWIEPDNIM